MKRPREIKAGHGRLLDAWVAPEGAGKPLGCIATSYTFSPVFFEEECLGRFLQLESDPQSDVVLYLIEREEKLRQVSCATVIVDRHHCRGQRSLLWDLLPARPRGGILHAKLAVMRWEQAVRLLLTSANLTESGYRSNLEIFAALDFVPGQPGPLRCFEDCTAFLDALPETVRAAGPDSDVVKRWHTFLVDVRAAVNGWGLEEHPAGGSDPEVHAILSGGERPDVLASVERIWPERRKPERAFVVSPFYDPPEAVNQPAKQIWNLISRNGRPRLTYCTPVTELPDEDALDVPIPESVLDVDLSRHPEAKIRFQRLDPGDGRSLHAKSLWFSSAGATAYIVGSSNFTSAGLGLSANSNLEANVAFVATHKKQRTAWLRLCKAFPEGPLIPLKTDLCFLTEHVSEEEEAAAEAVLPDFFLEAIVTSPADGGWELVLQFQGKEPDGWRVTVGDQHQLLVDQDQWAARGRPETLRLPWTALSPPSGLWVSWGDSVGKAWWPVNVSSSAVLPPPEELRQLPLDVLISILTSARPLHRVLGSHLTKEKKATDTIKLVDDPHKRVDVHGFILQRTRRFSWALTELRHRLARPVATQEGLAWRIDGPVGVKALAEALTREAGSEEEAAFLVAELALELCRVQPQRAPGSLAEDVVATALAEAAVEMANQAQTLTSGVSPSMKRYLASVIREVQA